MQGYLVIRSQRETEELRQLYILLKQWIGHTLTSFE